MAEAMATKISTPARETSSRRTAPEAMKANPKYAKAHFRHGVLAMDDGRWRQALADFKKVHPHVAYQILFQSAYIENETSGIWILFVCSGLLKISISLVDRL